MSFVTRVVSARLPKGVKDFLPERASRIARIEQLLFQVFERWGFRRVITPMLEYLEEMELGAGEGIADLAFKLNDRASGELLALRADMTPQVARMVAARMRDHPKPLRLYYGGSVLRDYRDQAGQGREVHQAGVELIGLPAGEADAEMIAIAIECLVALSLKGFKIDVGQVEFIRGVLDDAALPGELEKEVRQVIAKKDGPGISHVLEGVELSLAIRHLLEVLPSLYGGEEVIDQAESLTVNSRSRAALANLRQVLSMVDIYGLKEYISLDLGEIRGFDYHNGVIFQGFIPGQGHEILGGGRYDSLIEKYGFPCPATGFALNLEALSNAMEAQGILLRVEPIDFLLIDLRPDKREALELAKTLRNRGYRVARDIIKRDVDGSLDYAARTGVEHAVILGLSGYPPGEALLKHLPTGEEKRVRVADLPQGLR